MTRAGIASLGGKPPRLAIALALLIWTAAIAAALSYPELTGRVVDQANIISAVARQSIATKLADLEAKSGIQLVVATVRSLEGQEIEPYANGLFRTWKLGQKEKNNGVLLLVAPKEHRARIEVGYGLEGTLTDALSKVIITNAMTPRFKAGDFSGGITRGVEDIITVLTTDSSEWQPRPALRLDKDQGFNLATPLVILFLLIFIFMILWLPRIHRLVEAGPRGRSRRSSAWDSDRSSSWGGSGGSWSSSNSSSSSDSSDSFSGGGGSSGGGGASGSW
jgi:uncharacterized protein